MPLSHTRCLVPSSPLVSHFFALGRIGRPLLFVPDRRAARRLAFLLAVAQRVRSTADRRSAHPTGMARSRKGDDGTTGRSATGEGRAANRRGTHDTHQQDKCRQVRGSTLRQYSLPHTEPASGTPRSRTHSAWCVTVSLRPQRPQSLTAAVARAHGNRPTPRQQKGHTRTRHEHNDAQLTLDSPLFCVLVGVALAPSLLPVSLRVVPLSHRICVSHHVSRRDAIRRTGVGRAGSSR